MTNLDEIQRILFREYIKNGYLDSWNREGKIGDIAELGLIITEVAEAMEEVRNKNTNETKLMMECADILIRVLNFMTRKDQFAEYFILRKHRKNLKRGKLHGRGI